MGQGAPADRVVNSLLGRQMRRYCTTDKTPGTWDLINQVPTVVTPPYEPTGVVEIPEPLYVVSVQILVSPAAGGNRYVQIFDETTFTRAALHSNFNPIRRSSVLTPGSFWEWTPPPEGTEFVPRPNYGEPCKSGVNYGHPCGLGFVLVLSTQVDMPIPTNAPDLWVCFRFRPYYAEDEPRAELRGTS